MTVSEAAKRWKMPEDMLRFWCRSKRVPGAFQNDHGRWQIPERVVAVGRPHPGGPSEAHRNAAIDHEDAQVLAQSRKRHQ